MKGSTMSSYKHVLKERHRESDDERKRRDKDRNSNVKDSYSRKRSHSPHRSTHHKKSPLKSKVEYNNSDDHKGRKHHHESDIEELSRQKRKLESELRALDLEEAAEKEAENKKARREKSKHKEIKLESKEVPETKPKPVSNNSDDDRRSFRSRTQDVAVKVEKDKHKGHATKSGNEKNWGKPKEEPKNVDKEKPNFEVSGKLAEETNTYNGVVIKYNEPAEARKPKRKWRLYPFKGDSHLPYIPIHRQSAYLFGRTRLIADIPIDHPSCSKQHAVLQYRLVPYKRDDGTTGRRVRPYIIDLESSNGTFVNNKKVDPRCYVEIMEKDVIKFGYSSREYVLLHEESKNEEEDDDVEMTD